MHTSCVFLGKQIPAPLSTSAFRGSGKYGPLWVYSNVCHALLTRFSPHQPQQTDSPRNLAWKRRQALTFTALHGAISLLGTFPLNFSFFH